MNCEQICRLAAYQAAEVKQAGTLGSAVPISVIRAWANDANVEAEKLIRQVREDYFLKTLNSETGTTALKIRGINYTPSVTMKFAVSTNQLTLPPDFLTLKSIRAVTDGYEAIRIEHLDMAAQDFRQLMNSTQAGGENGLFYDIVGDRTLWFVPQVSVALDIELNYIARTAPLLYYATGTLAITDGTAAVAGTNTAWKNGCPFDANFVDLINGVSTSATVPTPDVSTMYDGITRNRVLTITDDTNIILAANKSGTLAAGTGYYLSSIPQLPEEVHFALADWVTSRILATTGSVSRADWFMARFKDRIGAIVTSAARRQVADVEVTEDSY